MFHNTIKPTLLIVALAAALMLLPAAGWAHNLWLNAVDFTPTLGQSESTQTKIYFGFGHKYPVHDFLERDKLVEFRLNEPDGATHGLTPGRGGFMPTVIKLDKKGGHIVSAATRTGFYTMYREGKRIRHKLGSMKKLENVVLSLYYENFAKALIDVDGSATDAFARPLGHNIEIVALDNPYLKGVGDSLKLQVLHKGRPASFCDVHATYIGFSNSEDYAFSNKTNGRGISAIRLLASGQWIVRAVVRKPAREDWKDKCMEEKYSATITFAVQ